eukprot:jgi/Hompol1/608/HPOL_004142-RA
MQSNSSSSKKGEFKLTAQEAQRFTESLKDKEFRKMFFDYVNELNDPAVRENEREIAAAESERGNNVRFIKPQPEYVIKTVAPPKKVFFNILVQDLRIKPSKDGISLTVWDRLAMSKIIATGKPCVVFDCVFHPDTIAQARSNLAFAKAVIDVAFEGANTHYGIKVQSDVSRLLKMKSKGTPVTTMIRTKKQDFAGTPSESSLDFAENLYKKQSTMQDKRASTHKSPSASTVVDSSNPKLKVPTFTIVHQHNHSDLQKYTNARERDATDMRPDTLVVRVLLPGVISATECDLTIQQKSFSLKVSDKYFLEAKLPYPVIDHKAEAGFSKIDTTLTLTLPVEPLPTAPKPSLLHAVAGSEFDNELSSTPKTTDSLKSEAIQELISADDAVNSTSGGDIVATETSEKDADPASTSANLDSTVDPAQSSMPAVQQQPSVESSATDNALSEQTNGYTSASSTFKLPCPSTVCRTPSFVITQSALHAAIIIDVAGIDTTTAKTQIEATEMTVGFSDSSSVEWFLHLVFDSSVDIRRTGSLDVSKKNGVIVLFKQGAAEWKRVGVVSQDRQLVYMPLATLSSVKIETGAIAAAHAALSNVPASSKVIDSTKARRRGDEVIVDVSLTQQPQKAEPPAASLPPASAPSSVHIQPPVTASPADHTPASLLTGAVDRTFDNSDLESKVKDLALALEHSKISLDDATSSIPRQSNDGESKLQDIITEPTSEDTLSKLLSSAHLSDTIPPVLPNLSSDAAVDALVAKGLDVDVSDPVDSNASASVAHGISEQDDEAPVDQATFDTTVSSEPIGHVSISPAAVDSLLTSNDPESLNNNLSAESLSKSVDTTDAPMAFKNRTLYDLD